jgi:phthalate 4,5-dioxygenase reductase component
MIPPNSLGLQAQSPAGLELFAVRIEQLTQVASDVTLFVLRNVDSSPLPEFEPGSHITVTTPLGAMRQYSLCGEPRGSDYWEIAVKREGRGRGGSLSLVDSAKVGNELRVSMPDNKFALDPAAKQYLFIAGGIGITPILSMIRGLVAQEDFNPKFIKLIYLTRDSGSTAFADNLNLLLPKASLVIHHDNGNLAEQFDFWSLFEKTNQSYVYCCGPKPLMDAVRDMTGHWPQKQIHFESFGADTSPRASDEAFQVKIASSGVTLDVEPGSTILNVLRANGLKIASSCESGTCGSCKTGLIEGIADHRDLVLLDDEKDHFLMPCVSRALSQCLTLDL